LNTPEIAGAGGWVAELRDVQAPSMWVVQVGLVKPHGRVGVSPCPFSAWRCEGRAAKRGASTRARETHMQARGH
jgi:hypothetical protein